MEAHWLDWLDDVEAHWLNWLGDGEAHWLDWLGDVDSGGSLVGSCGNSICGKPDC